MVRWSRLLNETLVEVQAETQRMSEMISDLLRPAQADSGACTGNGQRWSWTRRRRHVYRQTRRLADHYKGAGGLEGAGWAAKARQSSRVTATSRARRC